MAFFLSFFFLPNCYIQECFSFHDFWKFVIIVKQHQYQKLGFSYIFFSLSTFLCSVLSSDTVSTPHISVLTIIFLLYHIAFHAEQVANLQVQLFNLCFLFCGTIMSGVAHIR